MGNCLTGDNEGTKNKGPQKVKLLLLGSGECGKSTLFKQMKILYNDGFDKEELYHYKSSIYANIIQTISTLSNSIIDKGKKFDNEKNMERARDIIKLANEETSLLLSASQKYTEKLSKNIQELWKDSKIQEAFKNDRYLFHIFDGAEYFFAKLDKLDPETYVPSSEDVLRCRRKTTGIVEIDCELNGLKIQLVDVGGQRGERKKWFHCFDNVKCVIFVASLGDFDQRCYEDDLTNRMQESLDLFDEIINGNVFRNTQIMLFLNKTDILDFKITSGNSDLSKTYPKYDGGKDPEKAKEFIKKQYLKLNKFDPSRIHAFFTKATDKSSVNESFLKVSEIISKGTLGNEKLS